MAQIELKVPDIGDYADVPVIEVLVKDGEVVKAEQALLVLESDKATMEVPAPYAGTISGLRVKVGDRVGKGSVIGLLDAADTAKPAAPPAESPAEPAKAAAPVSPSVPPPPGEVAAPAAGEGPSAIAQPVSESSIAPAPIPVMVPAIPPTQPLSALVEQAAGDRPGSIAHAGPATRKFARELGVDLAAVKGSARNGRITVEDVQAHVKQALRTPQTVATASSGIPPIPAQDFALYGAIETAPLARIRKLSAAHLSRAWLNIPHVTQTDEADITELDAFRKSASEEAGVKLTLLPFVIKAVSSALKAFPDFNASLSPDGNSLILKKYCHIGFAADTPNGLVVPVVRDVWSKAVTQLAKETAELAKTAREGKLKPDDLKGGCFSISSLGGIGGSHFTPIVNAPEVAILGVSRGVMKPVWDGQAFQPRLMLPLSLSYDHRVIDGAQAARFIVLLVKLLSDLRRLVL